MKKTKEQADKGLHEERRLTVQKRNGRLEPFNEEKMIRSISRAGTPFLIAKDISKLVRNDLNENYNNPIISSNDLRSLIVEELKNRNQSTMAESYSGYKKNLITGTREELSHSRKYRSKVDSSFNTPAKQYVKDKDNTSGRGSKIGSH
jgi:transcriptional regulator NrdR family protein